MSITVKHFSFESKFDKVPIRGICMVPDEPIGILQMVHGMCEHKNRYLSFMRNMAERGYVTLMHDNRGHGESVKCREDIGYCYDSMETGLVGDVYRISVQVKKEFPGLPLILYGHSMGALIVRTYLRNHDAIIDGLILSACPSYYDLIPAGLQFVRMLGKRKGERYRSSKTQKLVVSGFESPFKQEHRKSAWLAAKKSVAEEYEQDEWCTFTYTLNGFETLMNLEYITFCAIGYQMKNKDLPILFISGMDDPCYINETKWRQSINRMKELGYKDIQEIRYPGMRHEIHNEEDNNTVFEDIDSFCKVAIRKAENR